MKFLMLVMIEAVDDPVDEGLDIDAWVARHDATGARFFGDRLAAASEAVTVRVRREGISVEAGPYAPEHRAIAGIDILEAPSVEAATLIALEHPMAREGAIEVRPFYDWDAQDA